MRLSAIILDFIRQSCPLIICAFFMGVGMVICKNKISSLGKIIEDNVAKNRIFQWAMISCAIIFICWGYILKSAFYTPYNSGAQGDNFYFIKGAMDHPNYGSGRHLIFPWIAGQLIFIAKKIGFLNPQNHLWQFYAFGLSSLPVRILSVVGLFYVYKLFKLLNLSFTKRILATLFLATTFGYWLWSIQPNALGIALGLECIALYYSVRMVKNKDRTSFFFAPLFILLTLYAHISAAYFISALCIITGVYVVLNLCKKAEKSFGNLIIYFSTLFLGGSFFLYTTLKKFALNIFQLKFYIDVMTNRINEYGQLQIKLSALRALVNNIGLALMNMFGLWGAQKVLDYILIFIILAIICALFTYILLNFIKIIAKRNSEDDWILSIFLSTFIIPFVVFLFLKNGEHYYVITLVPTSIFFLYLIFKIDEFCKKELGTFLICCLIPALFLLNGFSTMNVLKGLDFRQAGEFKKFESLYRIYPNEKVYFFETFDEYREPFRIKDSRKVYFFEEPMTTDYAMGAFLHCFSPAYPNIKWNYSFNMPDLLESLKKNDGLVIVGPLSYLKIKVQLPREIVAIPFQDNVSNITFYKLKKG